MSKSRDEYQMQMFDEIAKIIDETGAEDEKYSAEDKAMDIFNVLETMLAFEIYSTCIDEKTIEESAMESFNNIKEKALEMLKDNPL